MGKKKLKVLKDTSILKTITLGHDVDNPSVSICPGHVTVKDFNKAFKAEGWRGGGSVAKADIRHEYWVKGKKSWKKSTAEDKKAIPVTVTDW